MKSLQNCIRNLWRSHWRNSGKRSKTIPRGNLGRNSCTNPWSKSGWNLSMYRNRNSGRKAGMNFWKIQGIMTGENLEEFPRAIPKRSMEHFWMKPGKITRRIPGKPGIPKGMTECVPVELWKNLRRISGWNANLLLILFGHGGSDDHRERSPSWTLRLPVIIVT